MMGECGDPGSEIFPFAYNAEYNEIYVATQFLMHDAYTFCLAW